MATVFKDDFETGDFTKWSYIQGADTTQGGPGPQYNYVAPASSFGIQAHSGEDIAKFERPATATNLPHAKAFKEWSQIGKRDEFGRVEDKMPNDGNPSGTYKVWYYLPSDYQFTSREWTALTQFKEEGIHNGEWTQDPSWGISMSSAQAWGDPGGTKPVMFASYYQNPWGYEPVKVDVPLGRWFEMRADLYENNRIEWFLDGQKFDTSYDSQHDVGRYYDQSQGWIYGIGHYLGYGKLYADDASYETFGTSPETPTFTTANYTGTSANETIIGNDQNNIIDGQYGNDTIKGGLGDDRIIGHVGSDIITGGSGADRIDYNLYNQFGTTVKDKVMDFTPGSDRLDFYDLDANNNSADGNQAFTFLGTGALTGAGQIRYWKDTTNNLTHVEISNDADSAVEYTVDLVGLHTLSSTNFVL